MKKSLSVMWAGLAGLVLGLGGCEDAYSPSLRYGVRHDPVLMVPGGQLGDEKLDPDRPGQLPLLSIAGILNPRNPLYDTRQKIENAEQLRDPTKIAEADRQKMAEALDALFGTPAKPRVKGWDREANKVVDLDAATIKELKLDEATLEKGSYHYRIHCVHCHGVPGDGRGPTAQWVNPHPRDFRASLFKFQSVDQAKSGQLLPPRRVDLLRTIEFGLEGSAMPAFTLLRDEDREALASYVIHLSMRGRAELDTIKGAFRTEGQGLKVITDEDTGGPMNLANYIGAMHAINLPKWLESQKPTSAIVVAPFPFDENNAELMKESVQRGRDMFLAVVPPGASKEQEERIKATSCKSCHTDYGRQSTFRWDEWGTLVRPTNLTAGVYRAGRRPVDFYYRIHSGINGSNMAPFGANLPAASIWDLVNFVRSLPYPAMRQQYGITVQ